jgi:N,N'-diacetyllegionaminate synthase
MTSVRIGRRLLGEGQPVFIAAEIGINHNGDMELAKRMIQAATEVGADGVKFQNYRAEDFLSDRTLTYEYVSQGRTVVEPQYDMFKRCELSREQLFELRDYCDRCGVVFFSTPTGEDGLADIVETGALLVKNGSDYLTHLPLIQAMARSRLVTVLSTGMAVQEEIDDAVAAFREAGGENLVLLHCTSSYPTPDDEVNLRRVQRLAALYNCPVGFSDHTWGVDAAMGAVVLGACFVEKHFTLDKNLQGPDQHFSCDPEELRMLVNGIRRMELQLGSDDTGPTASELKGRQDYRLSCVARRDLAAGYRLQKGDIAFRRPGYGMPPKLCGTLLGRTLKQVVVAGHIFNRSDIDDR